MISTILTTLFSVICTAVIGTILAGRITSYFQNKNMIYTIKLKHKEDKIKQISDLIIKINTSSASRRFVMQDLINSFRSKMNIDQCREIYKKEITNWNISLASYNIELAILGLSYLAVHNLEGTDMNSNEKYADSIHQNFRNAHNLINIYIKSDFKESYLLNDIEDIINVSYTRTKELSNILSNEIENIWKELEHNDTDQLSIYNLNQAETYKLILAIFNPKSDILRIRRSSI